MGTVGNDEIIAKEACERGIKVNRVKKLTCDERIRSREAEPETEIDSGREVQTERERTKEDPTPSLLSVERPRYVPESFDWPKMSPD